jgi:hypothetical protein
MALAQLIIHLSSSMQEKFPNQVLIARLAKVKALLKKKILLAFELQYYSQEK